MISTSISATDYKHILQDYISKIQETDIRERVQDLYRKLTGKATDKQIFESLGLSKLLANNTADTIFQHHHNRPPPALNKKSNSPYNNLHHPTPAAAAAAAVTAAAAVKDMLKSPSNSGKQTPLEKQISLCKNFELLLSENQVKLDTSQKRASDLELDLKKETLCIKNFSHEISRLNVKIGKAKEAQRKIIEEIEAQKKLELQNLAADKKRKRLPSTSSLNSSDRAPKKKIMSAMDVANKQESTRLAETAAKEIELKESAERLSAPHARQETLSSSNTSASHRDYALHSTPVRDVATKGPVKLAVDLLQKSEQSKEKFPIAKPAASSPPMESIIGRVQLKTGRASVPNQSKASALSAPRSSNGPFVLPSPLETPYDYSEAIVIESSAVLKFTKKVDKPSATTLGYPIKTPFELSLTVSEKATQISEPNPAVANTSAVNCAEEPLKVTDIIPKPLEQLCSTLMEGSTIPLRDTIAPLEVTIAALEDPIAPLKDTKSIVKESTREKNIDLNSLRAQALKTLKSSSGKKNDSLVAVANEDSSDVEEGEIGEDDVEDSITTMQIVNRSRTFDIQNLASLGLKVDDLTISRANLLRDAMEQQLRQPQHHSVPAQRIADPYVAAYTYQHGHGALPMPMMQGIPQDPRSMGGYMHPPVQPSMNPFMHHHYQADNGMSSPIYPPAYQQQTQAPPLMMGAGPASMMNTMPIPGDVLPSYFDPNMYLQYQQEAQQRAFANSFYQHHHQTTRRPI